MSVVVRRLLTFVVGCIGVGAPYLLLYLKIKFCVDNHLITGS